MIGVRMSGRIGNQMFQYVFSKRLEKDLNEPTFYFEEEGGKFFLHQYFEITDYNCFSNKLNNFKFKLNKRPRIKFEQKESPEVNLKKITKEEALYEGYFQASEYFQGVDPHQYFKVLPHLRKTFDEKYATLIKSKRALGIHIRRTDYLNQGTDELGGKDLSLPMSYYLECINRLDDLSNYNIFVTGDDRQFAQEKFSNLPNVHISSNDQITDFLILSHCDTLIISNSSFAWWASFLNFKNNKLIYAPKNWLGFRANKEYPVGITNENWNWIDVKRF
jgi:hypothetical protein